MKTTPVVLLSILLLSSRTFAKASETGRADPPQQADLFVHDEAGYATYRIPALVVTPQQTVLVACEGRKNNSDDWGRIDLLVRRSIDGGRTWEPLRRLVAQEDLPADLVHNTAAAAAVAGGVPSGFTLNNPTWVACVATGTTHFLYCAEYFRCFIITSRDGGATFSSAREITGTFEAFRRRDGYAWKVIAPGPGHGIELQSGRLVVPVWLSTSTGGHPHRPSVCATIFSDDQGTTWHAGAIVAGIADQMPNASEATLAEVAPGKVMINIRSDSPRNRRVVAWSPDGATGWSKPEFDEALLEPVCMAGSVAIRGGQAAQGVLLFSNPASMERNPLTAVGSAGRARQNLTVRASRDGGRSWSASRVLESGPSAYSDLAVATDGTVFCFYERGRLAPYEKMTLARFPISWMLGDAP
ncbi:MAG: nedA [Verrucomicrobia bacterium]|nr:nedA [Verrucomicrobiota bacterium]